MPKAATSSAPAPTASQFIGCTGSRRLTDMPLSSAGTSRDCSAARGPRLHDPTGLLDGARVSEQNVHQAFPRLALDQPLFLALEPEGSVLDDPY